jgi:hypothetical protein
MKKTVLTLRRRLLTVTIGIIASKKYRASGGSAGLVSPTNLAVETGGGGRRGVSEVLLVKLVVLAVLEDVVEGVLGEGVHCGRN